MKIGREEIIALYCAIKQYMEANEEERLRNCEREVQKLIDRLQETVHFRAERTWPNQAGQPLPRAFVATQGSTPVASQLRSLLMRDEPGVFCYSENRHGVYINPMCLYEGEMDIIAERFIQIDKEL
jgi:D-glucosaminate-6-phosphate ammonia-lyase